MKTISQPDNATGFESARDCYSPWTIWPALLAAFALLVLANPVASASQPSMKALELISGMSISAQSQEEPKKKGDESEGETSTTTETEDEDDEPDC